jgi:hypothetical protein
MSDRSASLRRLLCAAVAAAAAAWTGIAPLFAATAVVLPLALAAPAAAQGTSGQLPDPISTAELSKLLSIYVKPSNDESATIDSLHDDYREKFRLLREGDIQKFLERMNELQGGGMMPSKDAIEEFTRAYERVQKQIADLDDALFEGIATLLGDERRASVLRARDARARSRALTGMMAGMMGGATPGDLSEIVLTADLSPEERAKVDPILQSYETRLTAGARELGTLSMRMVRDMFEEMEKAGFGNMSQEDMMADPEKMQAMMETMQAAMRKAGERFRNKSKDIAELNTGTFRTIDQTLQGEARRKVRVRWVARNYSEIARDPSQAERLFRLALKLPKLDPSAKDSIQAAYESWQRSDDAVVDQAIKYIDEFRATIDPMDFGSGWQDHQAKIQEFTQKRAEAAASALEAVKPLVGDERFEKILARTSTWQEDPFQDEAVDETGGDPNAPGIGVRASDAEPIEAAQMYASMSPAIPTASIAQLIGQLSLDEGKKALVETLHADYTKQWADEVAAIQERIAAAQQKMYDRTEDGGFEIDAAAMSEYNAARREMVDKGRAQDDAFFATLSEVLGEGAADAVAVLRLERSMNRSTDGSPYSMGMAMGMFGESEVPVNFVDVLRQATLSDELRTKVNGVLAAESKQALAVIDEAFQAQFAAEFEMQELSTKSSQLFSARGEGEPADMAEMQRYGMQMMEIQRRMSDAQRKRSDAQRGLWEKALAELPAAERDALQLAYDKAAYPSIFMDDVAALPYLERAAEMQDLSESQRAQVQALRESYEREYLELSRKMIPDRAERREEPSRPEEMQAYWQERMEIENRKAKIRFDRDERSQRAVTQLKRLLNEEQIKRLPGLSEYEKRMQQRGGNPWN